MRYAIPWKRKTVAKAALLPTLSESVPKTGPERRLNTPTQDHSPPASASLIPQSFTNEVTKNVA
jgi:hypothetical protein